MGLGLGVGVRVRGSGFGLCAFQCLLAVVLSMTIPVNSSLSMTIPVIHMSFLSHIYIISKKKSYRSVVAQYVESTLSIGSPMRTVFMSHIGKGASAIKGTQSLHPTNERNAADPSQVVVAFAWVFAFAFCLCFLPLLFAFCFLPFAVHECSIPLFAVSTQRQL